METIIIVLTALSLFTSLIVLLMVVGLASLINDVTKSNSSTTVLLYQTLAIVSQLKDIQMKSLHDIQNIGDILYQMTSPFNMMGGPPPDDIFPSPGNAFEFFGEGQGPTPIFDGIMQNQNSNPLDKQPPEMLNLTPSDDIKKLLDLFESEIDKMDNRDAQE